MTRIFIDSNAGLCPGVKRAISGAIEYARNQQHVYSYGELIHNPDLTAKITAAGIQPITDLKKLPRPARVIIRAHGITPQEESYIHKNSEDYIDLTCGVVKGVHKLIAQHYDYQIVIVGNPDHPETIGHMGYAAGHGLVIKDIKETEDLKLEPSCLIIAQTTTSYELFTNIATILKVKYPQLKIKNTICSFVMQRQEWIKQYAMQCAASLIIGGKNSSNTAKLYEIAAQHSTAIWIKNQDELDLDKLLTYESVALTAGTSTPEETINQVIARLYDRDIFPVFIG